MTNVKITSVILCGGSGSIVDVVALLTDGADAGAYWRKLKQRLKAEGNETVTNCHGLKMTPLNRGVTMMTAKKRHQVTIGGLIL